MHLAPGATCHTEKHTNKQKAIKGNQTDNRENFAGVKRLTFDEKERKHNCSSNIKTFNIEGVSEVTLELLKKNSSN